MNRYRRKFKEYYGIDFGRDYEVHHIDCNHENDSIENLMLLPKKLHRKYHMCLSACGPMNDKGTITFNARLGSNLRTGYETDMLGHLAEALNECSIWSFYKEVGYVYCDGSPMKFD